MSRALSLFRRRELEGRVHDEWRLHLDLLTEENVRQGLPPGEARRRAMIALGGVDQCREECLEAGGFRLLGELSQDFRYAFRSLKKNPAFTTVTTIVLALGIGANHGVLTLIDAIVFRPLPVSQPSRLIEMSSGSSRPDFLDTVAAGDTISELAAFSALPLFARTSSEGLSGRGVTANFFQVLGAKMAAGRGFSPEEAEFPSGSPVVVISHRFWQRAYGGDAGVIGKVIRLNGEPLTIIGVAPRNFRDIAFAGPYQDVWIPLPMWGKVMHMEQSADWKAGQQDRGLPWLGVIGRLRPGISLEQAQVRLGAVFASLKKDYLAPHRDWNPRVLSADRARWPGGNLLFASSVMSSAALCLLLIACINVAGLMLARASARQKEIATRLALGAGRARIIRQLLVEGLALSGMGLIAGIAVCGLTLRILPELEGTLGAPLDLGLTVDLRSMAVAAAIALISTLLFALTPALTASRVDLTGALKDRGFLNADPRGSRGRRLLVALQVLLSFILLVAAGLFARTILRFESMDAGFDRSVLLLKSDFLAVGIDKAKGLDFYRRSLDRIRELPGVRAASWAEDLPFERTLAVLERIRPEEQESDRWLRVEGNAVSSGYFKTVGMAILQGRDFTTREMDSSANVVIVNETLARRFWPGTTPVGKYLRVRGQDDARFEIVGVVKDAKYRTPWEGEKPYAYFPFWRFPYYHMDLHVSGYGDPLQLVDSIRKACQDVNPGVNLDNPRLMSAQLDSLLLQERSAAFLFMTFGGLALIMAAVGLYGIVSYSVARRTHEFSIRMALGARSVDIFKHVVSEGIALVLTGMAIGLPCCIVLARLLSSRLHGLSPFDPITYCGISLLCVSVAAIAVVMPARKAAKDPARALRCE